MTTEVTTVQDAAAVLAGLSSARTPWLTLALAGPADHGRLATAAADGDVTVVDITDPQAVPVMVNPFEPASGYPVQAHLDRLAGLFEAAFGLSEPVAGALRAGLRRAYADSGWDMRTGAGRPGTVISPAIPAFRQLKLATEDAARDLGYDTGMRAAVRGFLETRLDALWAGPAGLFLEGGHPAGLARLLGGNVLVTGGGLADEDARTFLAGVLLLRLAEQLSPRADRYRAVVVIAVPVRAQGPGQLPGSGELPGSGHPAFPAGPGVFPQRAGWFGRLLEDLRRTGTDVVVAAAGDDGPPAPRRPSGPGSGPAATPPGGTGSAEAPSATEASEAPGAAVASGVSKVSGASGAVVISRAGRGFRGR